MTTQLPNLLNDLFLHQGYLINQHGVCLSDLAPTPELPELSGLHLTEVFSIESAEQLQHQIHTCLIPPAQQPIEAQLTLFMNPSSKRELSHKNYIHSCMIPLQFENLALWQPIVMNRLLLWDTYPEVVFQQWLSLSLYLLWSYQRPFSVLMFEVTAQSPPEPSEIIKLAEWLPVLMRRLPATAVVSRLGRFRWGAILPRCDAEVCQGHQQAMQELFAAMTWQRPELHLSIASQSLNFWPHAEPPGVQPINQQLLIGLQQELKKQQLTAQKQS